MISDYIIALFRNNLITEFSVDVYKDFDDHIALLSLIVNNTSLISLQFTPSSLSPEIVYLWRTNTAVLVKSRLCEIHDNEHSSVESQLDEVDEWNPREDEDDWSEDKPEKFSSLLFERTLAEVFDDKYILSFEFLEVLQSHPFRLVKLTKKLKDHECNQIINAIPISITHLCIGDVVTDSNSEAFAKKIKTLDSLITLDLSITHFGKSELTINGLNTIFGALQQATFIALDLSGHSFEEQELWSMANFLLETNIQCVNFTDIPDKVFQEFCDFIKTRRPNIQLISTRLSRERLILGDGNFSFTNALVDKHPCVAATTIATEYMDEKELDKAFPDFRENIDRLKRKGVAIGFGIDATQLTDPRYGFFDRRAERRKVHIKRAHFNCPRIRKGPQETWDKNNAKNRALVAGFFKSVSPLQNVDDRASVVLPETKKPTQWPDGREKSAKEDTQFRQAVIYGVYDGAKEAGYRYLGKRMFDPTRFPGYVHKMTGENNTTGAAAVLREYRFAKTSEEISHSSVRPWIKGKYRNCLPECDTDPDSSDYGESDSEDTKMRVKS